MAVAVALGLVGPGRFALDHLAPWRTVGSVNRWLFGPRAGVLGIAVGLLVGVGVVTAVGPGFGSTPRSIPPPGVTESGDLARWCQLVGEVRQTVDAGGSIPDATLDDFADAAPDGIRAATQTATEAFKESIPDAFERPEVGAAVGEIEAFAATNCR